MIPPRIEPLISAVCRFYAVQRRHVFGRDKFNELVLARGTIAYMLRQRGWTNSRIGRLFGRDRSFARGALRRIQREPELAEFLAQLEIPSWEVENRVKH